MEKVLKAMAACVGAVTSFFTGMPVIMWVLMGAMGLDYASGLICGALGKSPKTESGKLSSRAAFEGLMRKAMILLVVALAVLIDMAVASGAGVEFTAVTGAVCLWFIASEGVSVLENAAALNLPVSPVIIKALDLMRGKGEEAEGK